MVEWRRQAGVLVLWAFLSFMRKMGVRALQQALVGYETSLEGICPMHDLQLGLFVRLLLWELPGMLWFVRQ